ncbi:MAG: cache domain-containing protein, partial [Clostridiales bacterium]|nr:cache domain-containing protein [Clostridiales bacterium]
MSIKSKILAPTIVIILAVAVAIMVTNIVLFSNFVDASTINSVNEATNVVINNLDLLKTDAQAVSLIVAGNPAIIGAVESGNRAELLANARTLQDRSGIDFCTISDSAGTVIARTHDPENFGDSISSHATVQAAMHGQSLSVIEEGTVVRLGIRAGAPILDEQGAVIGIVSVGFRLDTDTFVDSIKQMMGCEVTIVLGDERISTTVFDENGTRIVGTKSDANIVETVLSGNYYSGRVDI